MNPSGVMRRTVIPELLDTDAGSAHEIECSLADLRRINRWFGGASTTIDLVRRIARTRNCAELSLLEVAAGCGDVPETARRALARERIDLAITLLDRSSKHMNGAHSKVIANALALPFRDSAFDLVSCSLFAHHLEPDQLRHFAAECLRVARVAVVINDLVRDPLHLALVYAGMPLYRSRITRHDAPASVRRAYTPDEMRNMVKGLTTRIEITRHYLFRMGVILWK